MAETFRYRAIVGGRRISGLETAATGTAALEALSARGLDVFELTPAKVGLFSLAKLKAMFSGKNVAIKVAFFRAYAALESQGVAFDEAFVALLSIVPKGPFRNAVEGVRTLVRNGRRLSTALAEYPDQFSGVESALLGAGEESRGRAEILGQIAELLERQASLRKKMGGALTYPIIVVVVSILFSVFAVVYIVPMFGKFYGEFGVKVPENMQRMMEVSAFFSNPLSWPLLLAAFAVLIVLAIRWGTSEKGSYLIARVLVTDKKLFGTSVQPFAELVRNMITARLFRTCAALQSSGVETGKMLETLAPVAQNAVIRKRLIDARALIERGEASTLSEAFTQCHLFDEYARNFVAIGERVARVPEMMLRVAEYYDEDVTTKLMALPEKLQLVMMLGMGFVVAYLAGTIYTMMVTLTTSVGH